jgi:protein TonB
MHGVVRGLLALADAPRGRLAIALLLATGLCLGLLAHSVSWLTAREPKPQTPPPIEMQLVELEPPTPAAAATLPAPHAVAMPHAAPREVAPSPQHANAAAAPRRPTAATPVHEDTHESAHEDSQAPATPAQHAPHEDPAAPSTQTAAGPAQGASTGSATPSPQPGGPPSTTAGSTQARLLSQPLPVLPDDLREQGYQLTAIARFKVHADGSIEVELVKPTQNPRLNQILLETLHRWRFFPATENGHPVESEQDVRVHFSVS